MVDVVVSPLQAPVRSSRSASLDALRGLAVLLMVADHLALVNGVQGPWRLTVTRLAAPLFFVLAGHLVRRLSWRTLGIAVVGLVLGLFVPFIDSPNVLVWYAVGAVLVVIWRARVAWRFWLVVGLGAVALNWSSWGGGYSGAVLVLLMIAGQVMPREWVLLAASWVPLWLRWFGRWPLSVYVGHLLLLEGVLIVLGVR